MTDDSSWSTGPRRSADQGAPARHARTVDPAPTRGRHSFPETDFDPEPARRGARPAQPPTAPDGGPAGGATARFAPAPPARTAPPVRRTTRAPGTTHYPAAPGRPAASYFPAARAGAATTGPLQTRGVR